MSSKFKILAGASMSGKTYKLCREVLQEAYENPGNNFIIIIPDQAGNAYEKKLIGMNKSLYGRPGFMNIDVIGFNRLAYRIFEDMGMKSTSVIEEYEKSMLVRVCTGKLADSLELYSSSVDKTGFISEMKSLISELIQYNISPEDLKKAKEQAGDGLSPALSAKLHDISLIYKEFLNVLENGSTGLSEERLKVLTKLLESDGACSVTDGTSFIFDEFRGFTPDQLSVIGALSKRAEKLTFGICIDSALVKSGREVKDHNIFHKSSETIKSLQEIIGCKPELVSLEGRYVSQDGEAAAPSGPMQHLGKHLFRFPVAEFQEDISEDGEITVSVMPGSEEEIRCVAGEIRKLVSRGYRYKDIVIVTGNIESFDTSASHIFGEYDIPLFCDYNRRLRKNPYTEAILRLLDIVDRDFDYDSVFGFVKTGVLKVSDAYALDNLENLVLKTGIRGSKLWKNEIRPYRAEPSEEEINKAQSMEAVRREIMEALNPLMRFTSGRYKTGEYITAIRTVMDALDFEGSMETSAQYLEEMNMRSDAGVMRSLYNTIDNLLTQTESFLGEEEMNIHDFSEILRSGISEITIGVIPPTIDSVHACDPGRSRIIDTKILFFMNMNDGVIPTKAGAGRILSDKDREIVSGLLEEAGPGKRLAQTDYEKSIDEMFMLYQILLKPTDRLYLSYIQADEEGSACEPSFIVGRIMRLFPKLRVLQKHPEPFTGTPASDRITYLGWLRKALEEIHVNQKAGEVLGELIRNAAGYQLLSNKGINENVLEALGYSNAMPAVSQNIMKNLDIRLSVSQIESYAACPYEFFMQYIIGLKDRPEKKIESYDIGNVIHRALELTVLDMRDKKDNNWKDISEDDLSGIMLSKLDLAWKEYEMNEPDGEEDGRTLQVYRNLEMLSKRTIKTLREHIVSGEFLPEMPEQKFTAEFIANRPDGEELPITIQGKIDRLDTAKEDGKLYIRIIDYKTGSDKLDPKKIKTATALQLIVYTGMITDILRKKYEGKEVIPAGMYYYHVADPVVAPPGPKILERYGNDIEAATEAEVLKDLKLSGVSNDDPKDKHVLLNLHEKDLVNPDTGILAKDSRVIPVSMNASGVYSSNSIVLDSEYMEKLCEFGRNKMKATADSILSGSFDKSPIIENSRYGACTFCNFKSVCRFNEYSGKRRFYEKPSGSVREQLENIADEKF